MSCAAFTFSLVMGAYSIGFEPAESPESMNICGRNPLVFPRVTVRSSVEDRGLVLTVMPALPPVGVGLRDAVELDDVVPGCEPCSRLMPRLSSGLTTLHPHPSITDDHWVRYDAHTTHIVVHDGNDSILELTYVVGSYPVKQLKRATA